MRNRGADMEAEAIRPVVAHAAAEEGMVVEYTAVVVGIVVVEVVVMVVVIETRNYLQQ